MRDNGAVGKPQLLLRAYALVCRRAAIVAGAVIEIHLELALQLVGVYDPNDVHP